jgi:hypothetical protein
MSGCRRRSAQIAAIGSLAVLGAASALAQESPSTTPGYELFGSVLGHRGFSIAGAAGTSCVRASFCVAVGGGTILHGRSSLTSNAGLIWRYDGHSWRLSARVRIGQSSLAAVSCISATFCLAVGRAGNPISKVLALRWNGRSWSQVAATSPASSGNGDALGSVDCLSREDCWAVGAVNLGEVGAGVHHDLLEHWNGRRFTAVAAPSSGNPVAAIACAGTHDCWASAYPPGAQRTTNEIVHFNGRSFGVERLPESLIGGAAGISCRTLATCWIVGMRSAEGNAPVAMHLVSGAWRIAPMPSPRYPDVTLQGLDCASPSDCWAVGANMLVGPGIRPPFKSALFAEQWNGSAWQIATVVHAQRGFLASASCAPTGFCVAAGQTSSGSPLFAISKQVR